MAADGNKSARSEIAIIDLDGVAIRTRQMGSGDAAVLLLHGLGGDATSWTLNQKALAESRRVIAIDLPGHGGSSKSIGDGGIPSIARLIADLPDALNIDRFDLVGLSMGGAVALELAFHYGDRLRSLTCVSSAGFGDDINTDFIHGYLRADTMQAMRPNISILFHDERRVNDAMVSYAVMARQNPDFRAGIQRMTEANFPDGTQTYTYTDRLQDLAMPTHLIWGRHDRIAPPAHAERLTSMLPVTMIENAGHMPNVEAAEAFNTALENILQDPSSGCLP